MKLTKILALFIALVMVTSMASCNIKITVPNETESKTETNEKTQETTVEETETDLGETSGTQSGETDESENVGDPGDTDTDMDMDTDTDTDSNAASETNPDTDTETEAAIDTDNGETTEAEIDTDTECDGGTLAPDESKERETVGNTETDSNTETDATTEIEQSTEAETDPDQEDETDVDNSGCEKHVDVDNNGYCDDCSTYVIVIIDFYAINDLHGKFADSNSDEGVDELTTYLKNSQKTDDYAVFLSSGDMWQGSSESNLTNGMIITDWLGYLGFVSMTLGNHEFDWGEEPIEQNALIASFPLLAINVYDVDTDQRVEYCEASVMIERGGVKIGIIGAIGDCYSSIASERVEGVYFKTGSALTALVKAESEKLRAAGADIIIYSLHDGHEESSNGNGSISSSELSGFYDISLSSGGYVDLVFEGHTHQHYSLVDSYGVYHMQDGGDNDGISHVEIAINIANDNAKVNTAEFVKSSVYEGLEDDPIVDELLEKYADEISRANEVLGYNSRYRNSDYLCDLVAQLYLNKGIELWGDEYDIVLGGGFLQARSPYSLQAGNVTYGMLQTIFPFDNQLVLCSIKGSDLKRRFTENTNSSYHCAYDSGLASSIQNNKTYYIVVDSYSASYTANKLTPVERLNADVYARDLLADYIKNGGLR